MMVFYSILYGLSFLSLGLWVGLKALEKKWIPKELLYIGGLAASLSVYYFIFYLYSASPLIGHATTIALILLSFGLLGLIIKSLRASAVTRKIVGRYYLPPLIISIVLLVAYSLTLYSCMATKPGFGGYGDVDNRTFCQLSSLPFDNALPFIYGENILRNQDNKPAIDWSIADRPPLQMAATLPILSLAPNNSGENYNRSEQFVKFGLYYVFSIFLQLSWVGVVWAFLQRLKLRVRVRALVFITFAATGFFFLNSIFVWPKLLAASMVAAAVLLFLGNKKIKEVNYLPFVAVLLALGMLSHGGVLFTIIPFGLLLVVRLWRSKPFDYRYLLAAIGLGLLLYAPWQIYRGTLVKADRLAKWHFGGVQDLDQRGTAETIISQYRKLNFDQWLKNKQENVETLVTGNFNFVPSPACKMDFSGIVNKCLYGQWRSLTFFSTLAAFEFLIFGWAVVVYRAGKRKLDQLDKDLLLIGAGSLAVWVMMMFLPGSTVVHQGSYATMLLLFLLLVKNIATPRSIFMFIVATLQVTTFYLVWIGSYFRLP